MELTEAERAAFEELMSSPPFEYRNFSRQSDGDAWPGQYCVYELHLAWDCYVAGKRQGFNDGVIACAEECKRKWQDGYRGESTVGFYYVCRALLQPDAPEGG
jgi:hypothetical protein